MKKISTFLLIVFCFCYKANSQSLLNSMGVESGNLTAWNCYTGTCCPINTLTLGAVNGRHTVVSGNGTDAYGNFPIVCPWGGNFSLRIGNDTTGAQAERSTFNLHVDSNNYFITVAYAAVVQLAGHSSSVSSRFYFRVKDTSGSLIFSSAQCAACNKIPYPSNLQTSTINSSVQFLPWTQQVVNLKDYINQQVIFEVVAGDDSTGNQFGYGYFDLVSAGNLTANDSRCAGSNNVTIIAPSGFAAYQWFDANNTFLSNTQNLIINSSNWQALVGKSYYAVCTPTSGAGIIDTIYWNIKPNTRAIPQGGFSNSLLCNNVGINFFDSSIINSADPIASIQWNFGDASSANNLSTLTNPTHQYLQSGNYTVTQNLMSIYGCSSSFQKNIFINAAPKAFAGADDSVCPNQSIILGAIPAATNGRGNYNFQWISTGNLSNTNVATPSAKFLTPSVAILNVTDNQTQCFAVDSVNIFITSNCPNHPPVAIDDVAYLAYPQNKLIDVLQNDIDNDGVGQYQGNLTTASVTLIGGAFHGTVILSNNQIQYTAILDSTINDTIYYVLCDNGTPNFCDTGMLVVHCLKSLKVNFGNDITLCYGNSSTASIYPVTGGSGAFQYSWTPSTNLSCTNCANPHFQNLATTTYQLKVIDVLTQQQDSDVIIVKVDSPKISLGNDVATTFNFPNTTLHAQNLGSSSILNYTWNPLPSGICNNCSNPIYIPSSTTNVKVLAVDMNGCVATDTIIIYACSTDCVYPGDADKNGVVNNFDIFNLGLGYDSTGASRINQTNIWDGYPAQNWHDTVANNLNAKYADCNGDGIINANDTIAISRNYASIHASLAQTNQLPIYITLPHSVLRDSARVYCGIAIGDNSKMADNIYGFGFTFHFDPLVVDTNTINFQLTTPSWLFIGNNDYLQIKKYYRSNGTIDVGFVRNDHVGKSGFGNIATISIDITTGNVSGKLSSLVKDYIMHCSISDIRIINAKGNIVQSIASPDSAIIEYTPTGIANVEWFKNVVLMPNPAQNECSISTSADVYLKEIILQNVLGETMRTLKFEHNNNQQQVSILTQNLPNGIYLMNIITNKGKVVKSLLIQH